MKCSNPTCNHINSPSATVCAFCGISLIENLDEAENGGETSVGVQNPANKRKTMFEPSVPANQSPAPPPSTPPASPPPAADYFGTPQPARRPLSNPDDPFAQSLQPRIERSEPPARPTNKKATMVSSPEISQGNDRKLRGALFVFNNDNGRIFPIYEGRNSLGRSEDREIVLHDSQVSGEHGYLFLSDEGASYIDISTNGSRVNNNVVHGRQVDVENGSVIQVGALRLILTIIPKEALNA